MMIDTDELTGPALTYAVAMVERAAVVPYGSAGVQCFLFPDGKLYLTHEGEKRFYLAPHLQPWRPPGDEDSQRAHVRQHFGVEVYVPDELVREKVLYNV